MKLKAFTILFLFSLLFSQLTLGQSQSVVDRTKEELKNINETANPSIEQQFQYILDKSYNYSTDDIPFEVIKNRYILAFKEHLADSLAGLQQQIDNHQSVVDQLNSQIKSSSNTISTLETEKAELSEQTSTIAVFGLAIEKSLFKIIVLAVLVIFIVVVLILISKLKHANEVVENATQQAEDAQKEQEQFRRTSMQREQKLKRELLNLSKQNPSTISATTNSASPAPQKETPKKKSSTTKKTPKK